MLPTLQEPGAFVFRARNTDRYYTAALDARGRLAHLAPVANERRLAQFCTNESIPLPDPIPDADLVFDPGTLDAVQPAQRRVNSFRPSTVLLEAMRGAIVSPYVPPVIGRLLDSLCGDDDDFREHLLNWLACLIQHRRPMGTAWVFHGRSGTGKRLLLRKVIQPLLGAQHVADWSMAELTGRRLPTEALLTSCLLWVEDFAWHKAKRPDRLMHRLDTLISAPSLPSQAGAISDQLLAPTNHLNVILSAQYPEPLELPADDRCFILPPAQCRVLELTTAEIDAIDEELPVFAAYLAQRPADIEQARQVPHSPSREAVISHAGELDALFAALRAGSLEWFVTLAERNPPGHQSASSQRRFRRLVRRWCAEALAGERTRIFNADLELVAAGLPSGPYRRAAIRQSAKRYRITPQPLWDPREQRSGRGIEIRFRVEDEVRIRRLSPHRTTPASAAGSSDSRR